MNITEILRADRDDAQAIASLQEKLLLTETTDPAGGFLVSGFTKRDYIRFCDNGDYVFKATDGDSIVGAMIAIKSTNIKPEDKTNTMLKYIVNKDFVIVKQVFIDPEYARQGIATRFYRLLAHFLADNEPVVAVVVKDPPNEASFAFHAKNGLAEFLEFMPDSDKDGKQRLRSA